jgi:hypothetical protein
MKIFKILGVCIVAEEFLSGNKCLSFERNGETYLQFSKFDRDYGVSIYRTATSQYEIGVNNKKFYAQIAC